MAYITQYHTWTDEAITAANLNGNITNITDGLSDGTKDINVGSVKINGSTALTALGDYTGDITGDVTGTVSSISTNSATGLSDITDAGSGIIISGTERTNFTSAYTDTQAASYTDTSPTSIVERGAGNLFSARNALAINTLISSAYLYLDPAAPAIHNEYRLTDGSPLTSTITYSSPYFEIDPALNSRSYIVHLTPVEMESPIISFSYTKISGGKTKIVLRKGEDSSGTFQLADSTGTEKAILFLQILGEGSP